MSETQTQGLLEEVAGSASPIPACILPWGPGSLVSATQCSQGRRRPRVDWGLLGDVCNLGQGTVTLEAHGSVTASAAKGE